MVGSLVHQQLFGVADFAVLPLGRLHPFISCPIIHSHASSCDPSKVLQSFLLGEDIYVALKELQW